ncbi:hypothetical protein A2I65_01120 [Staphylococcus carnosus]|nr:hypothetical protein BEK99_12410 [Staphylococcus carnosus]UTB79592.1 hypothetical protein A2I65_01120 [Staphylococcus carnosus]UTB84361.1 hypothetical protein A2I66_01030 [Staphylococcus carnosus]
MELSEDKQLGQFFIKFNNNYENSEEALLKNYEQITGKLIHYLWTDVNKASFSEVSLFNSEIDSFSTLYEWAINKRNFFSTTFMSLYNSFINNEV